MKAMPNSDDLDKLINRLEKDGVLGTGARLSSLLRYITKEELEGRGDRLKAFAIATDVFGRRSDFDPQSNSIVRVEIGRLRRTLDLHFATSVTPEPLVIKIPKGSMRPSFEIRSDNSWIERKDLNGTDAGQSSVLFDQATAKSGNSKLRLSSTSIYWNTLARAFFVVCGLLGVGFSLLWISKASVFPISWNKKVIQNRVAVNTVGVFPFKAKEGDKDAEGIAAILYGQLRETQRSRTLQFVNMERQSLVSQDTNNALRVQHTIEGAVSIIRNQVLINVSLINAQTNQIVWHGNYLFDLASNSASFPQLATRVINDLRPQLLASIKRIAENIKPNELTALELFILGTWFPGFASNSLEWENERIALATKAVNADPKFGPAHAVIAEKMAFAATYDPPSDTAEKRAKAQYHAEMALNHAGDDPDAIFNVAAYFWHSGQIKVAERFMRSASQKDRHNGLAEFLAKAFPYTCSKAPDDVILEFKQFDAKLEPNNPVRWVTLGMIGRLHFNNGHFEKAVSASRESAHIHPTPSVLIRAAAGLVKLNKVDEARALIVILKKTWPNLSLQYFADISSVRQCKDSEILEEIQLLYVELARVLEKNV